MTDDHDPLYATTAEVSRKSMEAIEVVATRLQAGEITRHEAGLMISMIHTCTAGLVDNEAKELFEDLDGAVLTADRDMEKVEGHVYQCKVESDHLLITLRQSESQRVLMLRGKCDVLFASDAQTEVGVAAALEKMQRFKTGDALGTDAFSTLFKRYKRKARGDA